MTHEDFEEIKEALYKFYGNNLLKLYDNKLTIHIADGWTKESELIIDNNNTRFVENNHVLVIGDPIHTPIQLPFLDSYTIWYFTNTKDLMKSLQFMIDNPSIFTKEYNDPDYIDALDMDCISIDTTK